MAVKLFAAIDIGSYETGMKIFELSPKKGLKEIDHLKSRIDLGSDSYRTGKISYDRLDELCGVLSGFKRAMDTYRVDAYRACGTSAIRETENTGILLDQIRQRTGLTVVPLSNSEQRFLDYKSVALRSGRFSEIISKDTAFVDIGGGSTQVSLFQEGKLSVTMNLQLGILRLRSQLNLLGPTSAGYERMLSELIDNELHVFKKQYLKKAEIQNIVVIDDHISHALQNIEGGRDDYVTAEEYAPLIDILKSMNREEISKKLGIPMENASLLLPSAMIIRQMLRVTGAGQLWIPGVTLSDGIAYDYAEKNKIITSSHDFEQDIISCTERMAVRYQCSRSVGNEMVITSLAVFDSMKKLHGLDRRARLLLWIAARLRDCGRFVSLSSPAEASYSIIMGTEIIGLSHRERKMLASIVRNSWPQDYPYDNIEEQDFDDKTAIAVTKLTAILKLASSMSRSPRKKYNSVKAAIRDKNLVITIDSSKDILLEKGLFFEGTDMFEEVFGLRPVLRMKQER